MVVWGEDLGQDCHSLRGLVATCLLAVLVAYEPMSQGLCYKVVNWEVVGGLYLLLYGGGGKKVRSRAASNFYFPT